jgi:hypothetical protein
MSMPLGPFAFISLFYAVIGIRVVVRLVQSWRQVWDRQFTSTDRSLVDEAAFFVLIPISVALHEFGHAVAVWSMGGEVVDFGFYGFAGYVSYYPFEFTATQQTIVAAAGTLVNLALCLLAFGVVFFWRPPMRAAFNELLIQFAFLSGLNAFVVYPLLDVASGMNGDWRQMYDSGVPWLTGVIVAVQAAVLAIGYWLATNPRMKAQAARLTDVPSGFERGLLGGMRPGSIDPATLSPAEQALREATSRVSSGWSQPVSTHMQRYEGGTASVLEWGNPAGRRVVAIRVHANGRTELVRFHLVPNGAAPRPPQLLHAWPSVPPADELTLGLRVAMERADQER